MASSLPRPDEAALAAVACRPAADDGLALIVLRARRSPRLAGPRDEPTVSSPANVLDDLDEDERRLVRDAIDEVLDSRRPSPFGEPTRWPDRDRLPTAAD